MAYVLVVEDDAGTREWLTEVLGGAGHQVISAKDGLEAKSVAKGQTLDVVVTDISMPNEEGIGLILAMRRSYPDLKIIVLSGQDPDTLMDAILLGAHAAFRKPVPARTVLECINGLSQTQSRSPAPAL
jgi:DNA-binding NtrC family response regulator